MGFIDEDMTQAMLKKVSSIFHARQMLQCQEAEKVQRLAAHEGGERMCFETGEVKMSVHPAFYHYWGCRLGYECWQDKQFCREYLRDNPACRVKSKTGNIQVGWRGEAAARKYLLPNASAA